MIDDREFDLPLYSSVCTRCRHLILRPWRTCAAFPQGIPLEIWLGRHDHRTSYVGDHGTLYEPQTPADLAAMRMMAQGRPPEPGVSIAQAAERMVALVAEASD